MLIIRYATSSHVCADPGCRLCRPDRETGERLGHNRCQCCGAVDPELFMLRRRLWLKATGNRPELLLCWACTEAALGRAIRPAELTDCPLNHEQHPAMMAASSARHSEVMQREWRG